MMIKQPLQAVVVSIGEELLQGRVLDRNARFISGELLKLGIRVLRGHTIGDQPGALSELLQHLRGNYDLVITSGGLGPTVDDRVRLECANTCGCRWSRLNMARNRLPLRWTTWQSSGVVSIKVTRRRHSWRKG